MGLLRPFSSYLSDTRQMSYWRPYFGSFERLAPTKLLAIFYGSFKRLAPIEFLTPSFYPFERLDPNELVALFISSFGRLAPNQLFTPFSCYLSDTRQMSF
jgi:hypothetical protein